MRITRGTHFGDAFRADDVIREHWGSFGFLFEDCIGAKLRYASIELRFGEGTLVPQRLAQLAGTNCDEPAPVEPMAGGSWRLSTEIDVPLSESASAAAGGYVYTGGGARHFSRFQRFNPTSGSYAEMPPLPSPRHHPMMTSDGHDIYLAGGYQYKFGLENPRNTFWRFDPDAGAWEILPNMPNVRAAGAAVYMHDRVWILGGEGTGRNVLSYNIATAEWTQIPGDSRMVFDHIQAVAFENELWWMGGRTSSNSTFSHVLIWNAHR
jgi:non-specific serine/threonine protein kinase